MKIAHIRAETYSVRIKVPVIDRRFHHPFVLVRVETDDGIVGTGPCSGGALSPSIALFINRTVAPLLVGEDPLNNERIWQMLYANYNQRGITGVWSSAASAVDIALWDIKGKRCGLPVATLLGGAASGRPTYVTCGLSEYSLDELVEAARQLVGEGHRRLKMVVGGGRHQAVGDMAAPGDRPGVTWASIREDARRVRAVRDAVGDEVELMIDANCAFSAAEAIELARLVEECGLCWFEEPVIANNPRAMAEIRAKTRIPIAAGQFIGHAWEHAGLMLAGAVDIIQPGITSVGGFSEAMRVAATARSCGVSLSNGGGWSHHNLHLHAGVPNGGHLENHWVIWQACEAVFVGLPETIDGRMAVPPGPGLGFEPRQEEELRDHLLR